uniref:Ig-like domain-containing protein n=1 Tax=Sphaeramia orbicularis TaxID=375764 RepID=A0A673C4S5_9TELE
MRTNKKYFIPILWTTVHYCILLGTPVGAQCPVMIQPNVPVVKFEDPLLVNCTSSTDQTKIMGWEAPYGGTRKEDVTSVLLNITSAYTWDLGPLCYITFLDGTQCEEEVPITVYQMPQSVSLSQSNQDNPMVEGKKYQMRCDIVNVAPSRNLSVYWHKGDKIIHIDTFSNVSSLQPLNQSSAFELTAGREDNGSRIWCEAALNFGPSGPDLPPMESKSHDMIVQCEFLMLFFVSPINTSSWDHCWDFNGCVFSCSFNFGMCGLLQTEKAYSYKLLNSVKVIRERI